MTTPGPIPSSRLTPEATQLVETYFARVHGALLVAAAGECEEAVEDLRTHVLEELAASAGTPADVSRVLSELGSPEALAAEYADTADDAARPAPRRMSDVDSLPLSGTLLGMPYDIRVPTVERVALRWWNPLDPRVLVPRVFGLGWTINLGAVAVHLGLVRPDDEDVPFGQVPERFLASALLVPLMVAAILAVLAAVYQGGLPAQVPVHWGITGSPDGYWTKEGALLLPTGMTLLGAGMVALTWIRRRSALLRVAAGAAATMLATISVGAYGQSIAATKGVGGVTILLPAILLAFVLPFVQLVVLSRIGRAREMRRDLTRQ